MTEEARAPSGEPEEKSSEGPPRPRRRRGGRGRGRSRSSASPGETGGAQPDKEPGSSSVGRSQKAAEQADTAEATTRKSTTRRRRRRPSGGSRSAEKEGSADGDAAQKAEKPPARGSARKAASTRRRSRPAAKPAEPEDREAAGVKPSGAGRKSTTTRRRASGGASKAVQAAEDRQLKAEATKQEPVSDGEEPAGEGSSATKRRRRRRRRKKTGEAAERPSERAPKAEKATKTEKSTRTAKKDRPTPTAGPTRVSRSRRRGTVVRRRREEIIPERRLDKTMLLTEHGDRDQIAVVEGRDLVEHYVTRAGASSMVGNIYLGRVQNVLPGMEAAFVDVGRGRNAVLYAGEVSYDEDVEGDSRRIEQVLKPGQSIIVQVTKDPMGGKGARLTGQVSLPGRFLVYVPDGGASGISKRLPVKERNRLRDILKAIRPSGAGVIVRTAAEGATEEGLAADLERLKKIWDSIKRKSRRGKAPNALYEEPDLTIRVIRDVFSPVEFKEVVTDSKRIFDEIIEYLRDIGPDVLDRVRLHEGKLPVLEEFHVHEQIHKALDRKVWLPSGGYVIIDRTEAMTVVDVNTGKAVGKRNLEETVVQTNIEAAHEIARQLRLRDIGGIIVIDFIDMLLQANRTQVIRTLKEEMAQDKTRSQVFDITPLGLLEVTRKRVSAGLVESFSETCPTCEGRGILISLDA